MLLLIPTDSEAKEAAAESTMTIYYRLSNYKNPIRFDTVKIYDDTAEKFKNNFVICLDLLIKPHLVFSHISIYYSRTIPRLGAILSTRQCRQLPRAANFIIV